MTTRPRQATGGPDTSTAASPAEFRLTTRSSGKGTVDLIVQIGGEQVEVGTAKAISAGFWEASLQRAGPSLGPHDTADGRGPMAYKLAGLRELLTESIEKDGPWWQAAAGGREPAAQGPPAVPDLLALPEEPPIPDRDAVNSWSLRSMTGYLEALDRRAAWTLARKAGDLQNAGSAHYDVMMALAAAENVAPESERAFHAARLDAYASAHGLRGWYRGQILPPAAWGPRDGHHVFVNLTRSEADGERGRYYISRSLAGVGAIDRDSGQQAAGPFTTSREAEAWKAAAEAPAGSPADLTHSADAADATMRRSGEIPGEPSAPAERPAELEL